MKRSLKSPVELMRLAERFALSVTEPNPRLFPAWVRLGKVVRGLYADQAFDLAYHIVHQLPRSHVRSLGGSALAHLVQYHGAATIDWIESAARRDADFLEALSGVCLATEEVNPFVLPRLQAATGSHIRVFTREQRDASYRDIFKRCLTSRRAGHTRKPSLPTPIALVRDDEPEAPEKPIDRR